MTGKGKFADFCTFLKQHYTDVCGHCLLVQRASPASIARVSFKLHPKAVDVGDILLPEQLRTVCGYGQHKRNLAREAQDLTKATAGSGARDGAVLPDTDKVACVTMLSPHTCHLQHQRALFDDPTAALADNIRMYADEGNASFDDFAVPACNSSLHLDDRSETASLTSAAGLIRQQLKRHTNRGAASKSIASTLQDEASPGEQVESLDMKHLGNKLAHYGVAAPSALKNVRRVIIGAAQRVDEAEIMDIFQGAVADAKADGDYAEIIEATGAEITARAIELAELQYHRKMKRKVAGQSNGKRARYPKFDPNKSGISPYPDEDENGTPLRCAACSPRFIQLLAACFRSHAACSHGALSHHLSVRRVSQVCARIRHCTWLCEKRLASLP